jgi:MFS family permease
MTATETPTTTIPRADSLEHMNARAWGVLLVLCGAVFLEGVDVSMMGVALPSIRSDLGLSTTTLQWVVSAYVLGYGGFVLLGGRAADLLGRRRMFLGWLAVFVAFSGLGGLATEGWMLIAARFVTGVSSGFMAPAGLSIITTTFAEGPVRNRALLVYGATGAAGFSLGLVFGGVLTAIDWRWVFFAPVVLSALILPAGVRLVPRDEAPERRAGGFDLTGALTATAAMLLLVAGVVRLPDVAPAVTAATLAGAAVLLVVFVALERRTATPLVRLELLRSSPLVRADVGAALFIAAFAAFQFVVVLYLQELRGWSPLETGLALLVVAIDAILAPTVTPRLIDRFGTTWVVLGGTLSASVAYALFLRVGLDWTYASMLPTFVLIGIGFSLAYGSLTIAATDGVDGEEQGLASGLLNVAFQFGAALGLAVVAAVHEAATTTGGTPDELLDGYRTALVVPLVAAVAASAVTASGLRRRRSSAASVAASGA